VASSLFFQYNDALRPPYSVLVDTNFINFSIQKKLELVKAMMDCLYAKATPVITDCVMAELEKLGPRYRIALRIARDPRLERLRCDHKGTYADDCIVNRVMQNKIYIVATNDVDLVNFSSPEKKLRGGVRLTRETETENPEDPWCADNELWHRKVNNPPRPPKGDPRGMDDV